MKGFLILRFPWACAAALTMLAGLIWRSRYLEVSPFYKKYGGDALWAAMVFFLIGMLWPLWKTGRMALTSLAFSWAIEFSQLYHAPWIDRIRAYRLGALVLGSTYSSPDLAAYLVGILLAWGLSACFLKPVGTRVTPRT